MIFNAAEFAELFKHVSKQLKNDPEGQLLAKELHQKVRQLLDNADKAERMYKNHIYVAYNTIGIYDLLMKEVLNTKSTNKSRQILKLRCIAAVDQLKKAVEQLPGIAQKETATRLDAFVDSLENWVK